MKKKFVLTLALVLMVAASLVAATPLEVSGSFKTGYDFKFASTNAFTQIENKSEAEVATLVNFEGDFWKVSLATEAVNYDSDDAVAAKAELYLDKALAEEGIDLGDIALTLTVGNGVSGAAPTVLADKNGFRDDDGSALEMATTGDNFGITLGYSDLVKVYFSVDPTLKALPMVVGATITPVDGVDATVGFTNDYAGNNGMLVSAAADVAALAGLDFALDVTGEFIFDLDAETTVITADAATTIEGIGVWAAFFKDAADVNALAVKASYALEVEGFTVTPYVMAEMNNLSNIVKATSEYTIGADAKYAMGGATYNLGAKYEVNVEAFTVSPSVSISF
ncbi:MAG: hypothetical protein EOM15_17785 [Spirochaetia bacterium]|nr:hypothetical protein [Spirochaetia bacterium]